MRRLLSSVIILMLTASHVILIPQATAEVWTGAAGNGRWDDNSNWVARGIPNFTGAIADFSQIDVIADTIVTLNGNKVVGSLHFGDTTPSHNWILEPGTPADSTLTLDAANGLPTIDVVNQAARLRVPIVGNEGLTKTGFGTLALMLPNSYSGRTTILSGTLALDFSVPGAANSFIIPLGSEVRLGGLMFASSGGTLELIGAPGASTSQTFGSTTLEFGQNAIRVNQNGAANIDLTLGPLDRDVGSVLNLTLPIAGIVRAQSATIPNIHGILGGWATIGSGTTATWAANDGAGNIVPYTAFVEVTGAPLIANGPASNVRWSGSTGDAMLAAGTTDINTLMFTDSARRAIAIPASSTLRMGISGGIFKTDTTAGEANSLLTIGAPGTFVTAGGGPNLVGELILNANSNSPDQNGIVVNSTITNNGAAPVTVIKSGSASVLFTATNTYTDGSYVASGRLRTNATGGFGTGPVYVATGAQAYLDAGTHTNNFFISGKGLAEPPAGSSGGALRLAGNGVSVSGNVTLLGDALISAAGAVGNGATISGQITGAGNVEFSSMRGGILTMTNSSNNWNGQTVIGPGVLRIGGTGNVIPFSRSTNLIIHGDPQSDVPSVLDLNGRIETVEGLSSTGDPSKTIVTNSAPGPATLRLFADRDRPANFVGVIQDGVGTVGIFKEESGVQTLSGANTYSGPTEVQFGILRLGSSSALPSRTRLMLTRTSGGLDLAGFDATVSGLSGNGFLTSSDVSKVSTLTVAGGSNDFGGGSTGFVGLTLTSGSLTLAGANNYLGPTTVNGGTLIVRGALEPTGMVVVNAGGTLTGGARFPSEIVGRIGNLIMQPGSTLRPQGSLKPSSLTVNGGEMQFFLDVSPADRVNVVGEANFNSPSRISVSPIREGTFTLLTADTLRGIPPTLNLPTGARATFALNFETLADQIRLIITGSPPKALAWTGANGSEWDLNSTANWTDGAVTEKFFNLDSVRFVDGPANRNVVLNTVVLPAAVFVNNSVGNDYMISGSGGIGDTGFGGGTSLSKNGAGTLTLGGTNTYSGETTVNGGLLRITGSIASNNTVTVAAPANFAVLGTATVGNLVGAGSTSVGDATATATLTANHVRQRLLAIANGSSVVIRPNGGPAGTSVINSLSIFGATDSWTAKLDLNNNDAVVQSGAADKPGDLARIYNQLRQGFNNGTWQGMGIMSSVAAMNPSSDTGLSVVDNAALGLTNFSGQPVTADSILLKYTYYGDIDANGQVDADDLTVFANNFGRTSGATQIDGDIDFNGAVNADDLTVFANNFNKGVGSPLGARGKVQAVPEPSAWLLVIIATTTSVLMMVRRMRDDSP